MEPWLPRRSLATSLTPYLILCQLIEWLTGGWLFRPAQEELWDIDEDHLARMTEALGESFELSLLANCARRDKFFNSDGELHLRIMSRQKHGLQHHPRRVIRTFYGA